MISNLGEWAQPAARLVSQKAKPADHTVLLVFIVGGISTAELREVKQEIEERIGLPGDRPIIILGGTALLSPCDVLQRLWV